MDSFDDDKIKNEIKEYFKKYKNQYVFTDVKNIFVGYLDYNKKMQMWTISDKKPFIKPSHSSNYKGVIFDKNSYIIMFKESCVSDNQIIPKYKIFFIYQENASNKLKFSSAFFTTQISEAIDIEKKIITDIYRCVLFSEHKEIDNYPFKDILPNLIQLRGYDINF
jgi:hypothetical protein